MEIPSVSPLTIEKERRFESLLQDIENIEELLKSKDEEIRNLQHNIKESDGIIGECQSEINNLRKELRSNQMEQGKTLLQRAQLLRHICHLKDEYLFDSQYQTFLRLNARFEPAEHGQLYTQFLSEIRASLQAKDTDYWLLKPLLLLILILSTNFVVLSGLVNSFL